MIVHSRRKAKKALKADVKKGTALVKRVTALSDEALPGVLADVSGFNLTRYASEIAESLVASCSKAADVDVSLPVIVAMASRYADFTPALLAALFACLSVAIEASGLGAPAGPAPPPATAAGSDPAAASQRRAWIAGHALLGAVEAARARCPPPVSDFGGGGVGGDSIASDFGTVASARGASGGSGGGGAGAGSAAISDADRDARSAPGRVRVLLRLLVELASVRIYCDASSLLNVMLALTGEAGKGAVRELRSTGGGGKPSAAVVTGAQPVVRGSEAAAATAAAADAVSGASMTSASRAPPATGTAAVRVAAETGARPSVEAVPARGLPASTAQTSMSTATGDNVYALPRTLDYEPVMLQDKACRRLMRELPLLVSIVRLMPEELLGIPPRRTRMWLGCLPLPLVRAWVAARTGVRTDMSTFCVRIAGFDGAAAGAESWESDTAAAAVARAGMIGSSAVIANSSETQAATTSRQPAMSANHVTFVRDAPVAAEGARRERSTEIDIAPMPSSFFSGAEQSALRRGVDRYFDAATRALVIEFTALRRAEKAADVITFQKVSCRADY